MVSIRHEFDVKLHLPEAVVQHFCMLLDLLFDHAHILQTGATVTPVQPLVVPKHKESSKVFWIFKD